MVLGLMAAFASLQSRLLDTKPAGAAQPVAVVAGVPKLSPSASRYQVALEPVTVKVALRVTVLLAASRTVMVTAVLPSPTSAPAAGDCVMAVTAQLSVATTVAAKLATGAWQLALAAAESALV